MREGTLEKVDVVKRALADIPDSYLFAKFPSGSTSNKAFAFPKYFRELLLETDGPRGGELNIFPEKDIARSQHFCEPMDGGEDRWFCFGMDLDKPLFVERATGAVWWFPEPALEYYFMGGPFERLTEDLDHFMSDYLIGPGYIDIAAGIGDGSDDQWYGLLQSLGFAS